MMGFQIKNDLCKKQKNQLVFLFVLALLIRLYAALHTPVIAKDGTIYVQNALYISSGEFVKGLEGYPPGYPSLIAVSYRLIGNAEHAGQVVSVLMGTLALLPFYGLAKDIFGKQVSLIASIFFVFQPFLVQHSGEAISESTYIFFFISAIYQAWKALKYERPIFYLSFGFLAALAYLTRPEGIGLLFGFAIWLPVHYWLNKKKPTLLMVSKALFLLLPFLVLVIPYLYEVRQITGEWRLNAKRNMLADSGLLHAIKAADPPSPSNNFGSPDDNTNNRVAGNPEEVSKEIQTDPYRGWVAPKSLLGFVSRYIKTLFILVVKFTGIFHQLLFIFMIVLLIQRRFFPYYLEGESFLLFFGFLNLSAMALLYVSGRHLLQVVPLFLPWAAAGLLELSKRFDSLLKLRNINLRLSAQTFLIALTIGILLPKTLSGHRVDKLPLKNAGIWIQSQKNTSPSILSTDPRVTFYAKGRHTQLDNLEEITTFIMRNKPDFVVVEKNKIADIPGDVIKKMQPLSLKEVYRAEGENGASVVTVYILESI